MIGRWILRITAFLLFLPASQCLAAETPTSLQELILLGLHENLGLQASQLEIPVSREATSAEEGRFDVELFAESAYSDVRTPNSSSLIPQTSFDSKTLSGDVGVRKRFETGLSGELAFSTQRLDDSSVIESLNPKYQSALGLNLTQPLLREAGRQVNLLNVKVAQGQSMQARYAFLQQAQNLALGIEVGFYDLLKARSEERFREEAWQLTQTLLKGNQRKLDAGLIPITEVQEAETALAGRDLEHVLAMQQREVQAHRLNGLLNNLLPEPLTTSKQLKNEFSDLAQPDQVSVISVPEALRSAEQSRPDLQIAAITVDNSRLRENAAENRKKPRLDLNLTARTAGLSGEERSPGTIPYAGDWSDSLSSLAQSDGYQWGAGLQFSYPLGNRSLAAAYRGAQFQTRQSELQRKDLLSRVEAELRERLTQVQRLGQLVDISTRFQELAEISFRQETRRLEQGLSDTFRVLTFQEKMISAKIDRVAALVEFNKSLASLSYAMGSNLLRLGIVADLTNEEIRFEEN